MDIKSLTQLLQLSMMKNVISGDSIGASSETKGTNSQTADIFQLLLKEIIEETSNNGGTNISGGQLLDMDNNSVIVGSNNTTVGGNTNGSIEEAIAKASQKYGVDDDFIKAIIKQESGFRPEAVSNAGAQGLMQLMPSTARSLGVKNPFDVLENIDGGTKYIKQLMDSFGGNKELALSAYNGGIGRMNRRGVDTVGEINNMPRETQNYVAKVMKAYEGYKKD